MGMGYGRGGGRRPFRDLSRGMYRWAALANDIDALLNPRRLPRRVENYALWRWVLLPAARALGRYWR